MAKAKKKNPADVTQYALRKIRRELSELRESVRVLRIRVDLLGEKSKD